MEGGKGGGLVLAARGAVNTLFVAAFTYGRGIGGRQVPGQPFPDHGKQESDEKTFHGGNYATPHAKFYERTTLKETKAPDHGDYDVLADVLPKAHKRGMKVYAWFEDNFDAKIPGIEQLHEVDFQGRSANTLCPLQPDYREFLIGLTEDYCQSYELDGVMWGSERQGPLHNAIGAKVGAGDPSRVTCFCELHQKAAKERGIDVARAKQGFEKLAEFVSASRAGQRPNDGYFVEFWRLLLDYPELLAWEKLWTDSKHAIYADVYNAAKKSRASVQVGFHIWHVNSFSPFFRAEQNYPEFAKVADFLKIVVYNNCGGPRYASYIENMAAGILRDVPKDEVLRLNNEWLRVRIRAEDFDEVAMLAEQLDGLGDFRVLKMAVAINEEEIFPRLALAGARFDLRHVDLVPAERGDGLVQRADLVGDADHQAGAVVAGGRTALAAEHEEARGVGGVVLNVLLQHLQAVFFRGQHAGDGGGELFPSRPVRRNARWTRSR